MPTIDSRTETRLWDGAIINWAKHRVRKSIRCKGPCKGVFPGRYMKEVDKQTGLCRECQEKVALYDSH